MKRTQAELKTIKTINETKMECTQRLEFTQNLCEVPTDRSCPDQIGFLGICGQQYPIVKGPNKIGRDPQTCNIILNLNSISRQHAVINVLGSKKYMLMDLGSANKTKLIDKCLQPYIPYPLVNGDTVQFGEIFGIFRLLDEEDNLPMTQALDIPETPMVNKHSSKIMSATTIPESPDVSDKEESFVGVSQPKKDFKSPSSKFIKCSGKTISIQPIGTNKIDNIYWSSSKKSLDLSFENSNVSGRTDTHDTVIENNIKDIHEAETQIPSVNEAVDIHSANTQIPTENLASPSIHSLETQIPLADNLPEVCKINEPFEMECDLTSANKENDNNIHNAETQLVSFSVEKPEETKTAILLGQPSSCTPKKSVQSDEEIIFDEMDSQSFLEDFSSQPLLLAEQNVSTDVGPKPSNIYDSTLKDTDSPEIVVRPTKRVNRIESDSSTDCEDIEILPTQKVITIEEDITNCRDKVKIETNKNKTDTTKNKIEIDTFKNKTEKFQEEIHILPTQVIPNIDDDLTDCEDNDLSDQDDNANRKILNKKENQNLNNEQIVIKSKMSIENHKENVLDKNFADLHKKIIQRSNEDDIEDLPTQIIPEELHDEKELQKTMTEAMHKKLIKKSNEDDIEDLPTQIIPEELHDEKELLKTMTEAVPTKKNNEVDNEDFLTQVIPELPSIKPSKTSFETIIIDEVPSPFKVPTQSPRKTKRKDIHHIITPKNFSPQLNSSKEEEENYYAATQEILNDLSTQLIKEIPQTAVSDPFDTVNQPPDSNADKKVAEYVSRLSSKEITEIVVGSDIQIPRRVPSDSSDVEETPKKVKPLKLMETDLPDSQEIKANVNIHSRNLNTEEYSDSEPENNSEECTPILFKNKKKLKKKIADTKVDLTKRFDELPTRVLTRVRKPTAKALNSGIYDKDTKVNNKKLWSSQENELDSEIIEENLMRLRHRIKKKLPIESNTNDHTTDVDSKNVVKKDSTEKDEMKILDNATVNLECNKNVNPRGKSRSSRNKEDDNSKYKPKRTQKYKIKVKEVGKDSSCGINESTQIATTKISKTQGSQIKTALEKNNSKEDNNTSHEIREEETRIVEKRSRTARPNEKYKNSREEKSNSPEIVEIRRSARQKPVKEEEPPKPKSIMKESKSNDQSTVYSLSESSIDSPKSLKRSAEKDSDVSRPKRSCNKRISKSSCLRSTPARSVRSPHVLFTAFPESIIKDVSSKLNKLGAVVVSDVMACTVVVTASVKRTFKFLCAAALGRPIVGPSWVQACHDTNIIVDPWLYLLEDETAEKRFQFNLRRTLTGKRNFLKGHNVSCTPNVKPGEPEMKLIVECSGGTWIAKGPRWVCVSCLADKGLWSKLRKEGAIIVGVEFILSGVLRQQVDIAGNLLIN